MCHSQNVDLDLVSLQVFLIEITLIGRLSNKEICVIITARKRSLHRLCFHRCLSTGGGGLYSGGGPFCPEGGLCQGTPALYGYVRAVRILLECILVFD